LTLSYVMGSLNANDVRCVFIFHFRKTIYLQCTFYYADGVAYYLEKAHNQNNSSNNHTKCLSYQNQIRVSHSVIK
jgi:hypothetical protein